MSKPIIVNENMLRVFESAAEFQRLVPDAVLVGGTAASAYAGHRYSVDHDHVLADLEERFASIFDMLAAKLVELLGTPNPKDKITTKELRLYKGLDEKFADWDSIVLQGDLEGWHRLYIALHDDQEGRIRETVEEALDVLEQGDVRPGLADVFRLLLA